METTSTTPATTTPEQHEAKAAEHREAARESFERCDTDGFLSQWADGLHAQTHTLAAEIARRDGRAWFPALFNLRGERVQATLEYYPCRHAPWKTEPVWKIRTAAGTKFAKAFPARASTMNKKGYAEAVELAPAEAKIVGTGRGLSGRAWVAAVRTDGGCPAAAVLG